MKTYFSFILICALLLFSANVFAQTDMNENSIILSDMKKNAYPEELSREKSVNIERNIPQSLLNQLDAAKQREDTEEIERLINIMNRDYSNGINVVTAGDHINTDLPAPPDGSNPPFIGDWQGTDVTLSTFTGQNYNPRTMDMVMAEDGNLYVAFCTDETTNRFIRVYRSSNSGLSWTNVGGLQTTGYISSISMVCDQRGSTSDSMRVICYYTRASATNNDGAVLAFVSFKPNASPQDYIIQTISTPAAGNEFNYCSAVSDGQYFSTATWQSVVAGEYNNANDDLISFHYLRTTNWGTSHTEVTFLGGNDDFFPSAGFVGAGSDSVFIAVERRFSGTQSEIRLIKTPFAPTAATTTDFLTSGGAGVLYAKPVLTVQQTAQSIDHRMIITCTKDGIAKYLNSVNSGGTWGIDFTLGPTSAVNVPYTWCDSDTNQSAGGYFVAIWRSASGDSINVRRGVSGSLGTTENDVMSNQATGTAFPVCAVYHNSDYSVKRSAVSIYGFGGFGTNAYFNAENLPVGITPTSSIAEDYKLNQNYPNPFNPSTNISFSIPKNANVRIVVYDMLGKEIATLVNKELLAGSYSVDFNAAGLSTGVYFYKLITNDFTDIKKMTLL